MRRLKSELEVEEMESNIWRRFDVQEIREKGLYWGVGDMGLECFFFFNCFLQITTILLDAFYNSYKLLIKI